MHNIAGSGPRFDYIYWRVLEVDVERAWKEMGLDSGWSNEVSLEVFVH